MRAGTRVKMRDIGGQVIAGTVLGPGPTTEVRPLNPQQDEDIATVKVRWDDEALGTDTVAVAGLERA